MEGLQANNILACAKHFPGHGRVNTDSHIEDCVTDIDFETLRGADILPFKEIHSRFDKYNIEINEKKQTIDFKDEDEYEEFYEEYGL